MNPNRTCQQPSQRINIPKPSCENEPAMDMHPFEQLSQAQLIKQINEISFGINDIVLFLDTHPYDCDAKAYSNHLVKQRDLALRAYAKNYAPLIIDDTDRNTPSWDWILQPWPWEINVKGGCK